MKRSVIRRPEMQKARLDLGGRSPIELADYATTGLVSVAIGPRGIGKTNIGLVIGEQLAEQGWVTIFIDPEQELEMLYGDAVESPEQLGQLLSSRKQNIIVVNARDASDFLPFGEAILEAADAHRKPIFVVIDEGQLFSATRKRSGDVGRASDIVNELVGRGRKRAVDLFITAHSFTATLNRGIFTSKNLTLVGCQEDPTKWPGLAPLFRAAKIDFNDLNSLSPGEFYCLSRRGVEKVRVPMAGALREVAPKAQPAKRVLPATFTQWDRAMRQIPTARMTALTPDVTALLGAVAGLSSQQMATGLRALADELSCR